MNQIETNETLEKGALSDTLNTEKIEKDSPADVTPPAETSMETDDDTDQSTKASVASVASLASVMIAMGKTNRVVLGPTIDDSDLDGFVTLQNIDDPRLARYAKKHWNELPEFCQPGEDLWDFNLIGPVHWHNTNRENLTALFMLAVNPQEESGRNTSDQEVKKRLDEFAKKELLIDFEPIVIDKIIQFVNLHAVRIPDLVGYVLEYMDTYWMVNPLRNGILDGIYTISREAKLSVENGSEINSSTETGISTVVEQYHQAIQDIENLNHYITGRYGTSQLGTIIILNNSLDYMHHLHLMVAQDETIDEQVKQHLAMYALMVLNEVSLNLTRS